MFSYCTFGNKPTPEIDVEHLDFHLVWTGGPQTVGPDHELAVSPGDEVVWVGVFDTGILVKLITGPYAGKYFGAVQLEDISSADDSTKLDDLVAKFFS